MSAFTPFVVTYLGHGESVGARDEHQQQREQGLAREEHSVIWLFFNLKSTFNSVCVVLSLAYA